MRNIAFIYQIGIMAITVTANGQRISNPVRPWNATVQVVDESGQAVSNATVEVSFYVKPPPGRSEAGGKITGLTDSEGMFRASHEDTRSGTLGFQASKEGYYTSSAGYNLFVLGAYTEEQLVTNRNPRIRLLLKKIGHPIPMYTRYVEGGPPVFNEPVGYDLMVGDWIAPHGKGQTTDVVFTGHLDRKSPRDFDYKLVVSFPNQGDGIQEFRVSKEGKASALRSLREAPSNGYQPQVTRIMSRHPGKGTVDDSDKDRNYYFRVRTVLDKDGNVKSALYGKIYGDFMQFRYYLNPTPNDRNVEFDLKENLLKGLKSQPAAAP